MQPADRLVGVLRRVHDVRPVDERGDAGVDGTPATPTGCRHRHRRADTSGRTCRGWRRSRRPACSPARDVRIEVSHVCRCVSTNPGMTMSPSASMTRAPSAAGPRPTSAIRSPSTSTSASSISPRLSSWVSTVAPRMRMRVSHEFDPFLLLCGSHGSAACLAPQVGRRPPTCLDRRPNPRSAASRTICWLTRVWGIGTPSQSASSRMSRRSLAARASEKATGRGLGVDEGVALVPDVRRPGGDRGEHVVRHGAVDARPSRPGRAPR